MSNKTCRFRYPRRKVLRYLLSKVSIPALNVVAEVEINGQENIPKQGPLLVVGNHFSFLDPVAFVRLARWPIEFVGGSQPPHAPKWSRLFPMLWGFLHLYRGTGSTEALKAGVAILNQNGVLGIFPEGGNWAQVLRPARPGTAYLTTMTNAPMLPVGLSGLVNVFPSLKKGKRARITINIGKIFGPFQASGRGREKRRQLDEIGHEIMRRIAELLPPEERGHYSDNPAIRAAAKGTEVYPWADKTEGEVTGLVR
ncbi:MAG: 1-acyl-sn-glycerol-3-phosphate acyltransferase [Anaerolineales bacterium]|nr:1-acyl-sn-glycerol-3-phosphate acyltransferase [Anaerolineales bacterium]